MLALSEGIQLIQDLQHLFYLQHLHISPSLLFSLFPPPLILPLLIPRHRPLPFQQRIQQHPIPLQMPLNLLLKRLIIRIPQILTKQLTKLPKIILHQIYQLLQLTLSNNVLLAHLLEIINDELFAHDVFNVSGDKRGALVEFLDSLEGFDEGVVLQRDEGDVEEDFLDLLDEGGGYFDLAQLCFVGVYFEHRS